MYFPRHAQRRCEEDRALGEFSNPRRKGILALNIDEGDELIAARHVNPVSRS